MRTLLILTASLAAFGHVMAQEQPVSSVPEPIVTPPPAPTPEPAVASEATAITPAESAAVVNGELEQPPAQLSASAGKDTLTVDFPDEEVRTILRNVADLFELNLVIPDTLQGRTSLKLREVTWRQIYQVILSPIGYTYVEDGNIIKIVSQAALAEEPVGTEIFIVNYAKADDVRKSIEALVDTAIGGRVVVDARSNALIISERPSRLGRIRPIIEKLDKATDQVTIESKFIQITDTDARNLGVTWPTSVSGGVSEITNTVTGNALPRNTINNVFNTSGVTSATFTASEFSVLLNALQTNQNTRLVNNPTVVTLNNATASINIGEEFPIPSYTYNAEQGRYEVSGFEYKPIGVNLNVTPQINSQGFIKLTLEPEISSTDRNIVFGSGANAATIPVVKSTKTKTQVSLKDGHTLGIGGLISDNITDTVDKVPFLGNVPVLGKLFTNNNKSNTRNNTLIFITAKVVSSETADVSEIFDPRTISSAGLKRSDITGYRNSGIDPFLPEDAPVEPASTTK